MKHLGAPFRTALNSMFTRSIEERDDLSSRQLGARVFAEIHRRAKSGDVSAQFLMLELAARGVEREAHRYLKSQMGTITRIQDGVRSMIRVPLRLGRRERGEKGEITRFWQQSFWYTLPWPIFVEAVNMLARQRDRLHEEVVAFNDVLRLREKYPDSSSPLEACEIEGVDPRNIDVAAIDERTA